MSGWRNWSGLATADPAQVHTPRDADEVRAALEAARAQRRTVKMVGAGHSFTAIAAPEQVMLRPDRLTGITAVDRDAMTVTVLAGTRLHDLNRGLESLGLSLHNMGDIDQQTIAGAISTGTHGTGGVWASLSAQVVGLEMVTGTGELLRADATEHPDVLAAARVGLGALGVLTSVTLAVEPLFTLSAHEGPMSYDAVLAEFDALSARHHHVEAYWFPHTDRCLLKRNDRVLDPPEPLPAWRRRLEDDLIANTAFDGINRLGDLRPGWVPALARVSARALSERSYSDAAWRVFTSPRSVVFKEMEYALPRESGLDALREARSLIERSGWHISFPVEVRTAPADDITLSTASGRDSLYLAFHVNARTDHTAYFAGVERVMLAHGGRPHWGKLHTRTAEDLAQAYPRWQEFATLRDRLDPDRVLTNDHLRRVLG